MRTWDLALGSPSGREGTVYREIARRIADDVVRGRLKPGEKLPSSRALADALGVNRTTVVAAYEVLRAEGWIEGRPASGTYVAARAPTREAPAATGTARAQVALDLPPAMPLSGPIPRVPGRLLLLGGVPELRFVPNRELARAYRSALRGARARRLVDYADPRGNERLRTALVEMLGRRRGIAVRDAGICTVRGSQHALYLCARTLIRPGDRVAVEALGFPGGWDAFRLAGAELVPVPVDAHGLDVDALARACADRPVRAVVVTPHHHYPSTVTLPPDRRRALLALARDQRMIVVEDDYDFDHHYDGAPILPLAAADVDGVVVYVATLSKTLAPGLRLGYVVARPEIIDRIAAYRLVVDQQGDHVLEQAIAELLEEGVVQRHVRRVQRAYRARRDALCDRLARHLPELTFAVPAGGMALWAHAPGVDTDAWVARGLEAGVAFQAGSRFRFDRAPHPYVRLGFAACTETELDLAVERLVGTLHP